MVLGSPDELRMMLQNCSQASEQDAAATEQTRRSRSYMSRISCHSLESSKAELCTMLKDTLRTNANRDVYLHMFDEVSNGMDALGCVGIVGGIARNLIAAPFSAVLNAGRNGGLRAAGVELARQSYRIPIHVGTAAALEVRETLTSPAQLAMLTAFMGVGAYATQNSIDQSVGQLRTQTASCLTSGSGCEGLENLSRDVQAMQRNAMNDTIRYGVIGLLVPGGIDNFSSTMRTARGIASRARNRFRSAADNFAEKVRRYRANRTPANEAEVRRAQTELETAQREMVAANNNYNRSLRDSFRRTQAEALDAELQRQGTTDPVERRRIVAERNRFLLGPDGQPVMVRGADGVERRVPLDGEPSPELMAYLEGAPAVQQARTALGAEQLSPADAVAAIEIQNRINALEASSGAGTNAGEMMPEVMRRVASNEVPAWAQGMRRDPNNPSAPPRDLTPQERLWIAAIETIGARRNIPESDIRRIVDEETQRTPCRAGG